MRNINVAGAAFRFLMVVIGAALATSALDPQEALASTNRRQSSDRASGFDQTGTASWYGPRFHGRKTANGETYDQWGMTAAHRTLPLGSVVYVTNQRNGKTARVRINDRGPYAGNRIIDLSTHVADVLGIRSSGLGQVRVRTTAPDRDNRRFASTKGKSRRS